MLRATLYQWAIAASVLAACGSSRANRAKGVAEDATADVASAAGGATGGQGGATTGGQAGATGGMPATGGAGAAGTGGSGGAPAAGEGCLAATVRRAPGDSQQPWVKWSLWADGVGTLVVSATGDGAVKARKAVANADLRAADARYTVDLGCPGAGTYTLRAFLDDNGNAGADQVTSDDKLDSCMGGAVPEKVDVTVTAGRTANAELVLYQSCNPLAD